MIGRLLMGRWIIVLATLGFWSSAGHAQSSRAPAQFQPQPQAPAQFQLPAPAQPQPKTPAQPPENAQAPPEAQNQAGYSAPALYNLANSYARAGKRGMAVLNYERARLLDPRDPDIGANQDYVRQSAGLPPQSIGSFDRIARIASPRILAGSGLAGLVLIGVSLLARQTYPRRRLRHRTAFGAGIALVAITVCSGVALWPVMHEAVVITRAAPVRVSPVTIGEPQFTLPEAEIVRISAVHEDFVLVRTRAGRTGWALQKDLAPIVPPQSHAPP